MAEYRRILLGGTEVRVERHGDLLHAPDGRTVSIAEAIHLPPVRPTKIICTHLNHISRVREFGTVLPPAPTYFHKPVSALNSHGADVVRPSNCSYLNYEGEVAIVIGRQCRNVTHAQAWDYIEGYTVANDFGLHDFRDTDSGSMLRVKGADTLCPIGPGVVTGWDPNGKFIKTYVNGVLRQDGTTDEMAWDMGYLVADLARLITLEPGDIILSGTPAISRPVEPGDVVTVDVEGLGALTNTIVVGPTPVSDEIGSQPTASEEVLSTAHGADWEFRGQRKPVYPTPRDQLPYPRVRPRVEQ
jgi:5-oxopent-3-ene-1,2,5-tricarboxylate decarboxylase / 2-hydroxyhepta-2,4-diene-1,7-dioate isomerase